jgi:hypothetical protein
LTLRLVVRNILQIYLYTWNIRKWSTEYWSFSQDTLRESRFVHPDQLTIRIKVVFVRGRKIAASLTQMIVFCIFFYV